MFTWLVQDFRGGASKSPLSERKALKQRRPASRTAVPASLSLSFSCRLLEAIAEGDGQVEVMDLINVITAGIKDGVAVLVAPHVGNAPVATNREVVVLVVLGTYAEAQSGIPALEVRLHRALLEGVVAPLRAACIRTVGIGIELVLAPDTHGEVGTDLTIHTQLAAEVVAVTHAYGNLHVV